VPLPDGVRALLLDVEGTTTPIAFVHDELFPYARRRLAAACREAAGRPEVEVAIERLRGEYGEEAKRSGAELPPFGDGAAYAAHLMDLDRKSTGLKALQGILWEDGYRSGELRGRVFDDVPAALAAWRRLGARVRIFSSGSVLAQRLLFAHSDHGDLTPFIEGYHDTTTGPKREPASYASIATDFRLAPRAILFLSDVVAELDAAAAAGLATGLVLRPGNQPAEPRGHATWRGFDELT
jgi:enolase-phosphatase E1